MKLPFKIVGRKRYELLEYQLKCANNAYSALQSVHGETRDQLREALACLVALAAFREENIKQGMPLWNQVQGFLDTHVYGPVTRT